MTGRAVDMEVETGLALLDARRLPEAELHFERVVRRFPESAAARRGLVALARSGGDKLTMVARLDDLLRLEPDAIRERAERAAIRASVTPVATRPEIDALLALGRRDGLPADAAPPMLQLIHDAADPDRYAEQMRALGDLLAERAADRPDEAFEARIQGAAVTLALGDHATYIAQVGRLGREIADDPGDARRRRLAPLRRVRRKLVDPRFPDSEAPKVFGIGLSRTGTTSLNAALNRLGLHSIHWWNPITFDLIRREDVPLFDGFTDISVAHDLEWLVDAYPEAKFVYTTRPVEDWAGSVARHYASHHGRGGIEVLRDPEVARRYRGLGGRIDAALYTPFEDWADAYHAHDRRVRDLFADRPGRLLEVSPVAGDGWAPLCAFLDKPIPATPFPHSNPRAVRSHASQRGDVIPLPPEAPLAPPPGGVRGALDRLIEATRADVAALAAQDEALLRRRPRHLRLEMPLYYDGASSIAGARAHLAAVEALAVREDAEDLCRDFAALRDAFSLNPGSSAFRPFLADILAEAVGADARRLRADCAGKRVVLHTACRPRLDRTAAALASFGALDDERVHHVVLLGTVGAGPEDDLGLGFAYDGRRLEVPAPDDYEGLHRKLFYAYMLLDLIGRPEMVVKIDDDLRLQDADAFGALLDRLAADAVPYAGRALGPPLHTMQRHGWHVGKCADPVIERRGFQYPLPRTYAGGGFGYVLGRDGLAACSYAYLAMKAFFDIRSVGIEDAIVGHAAYAMGLDLVDVSEPPRFLALPGLTTQGRLDVAARGEG